MKLLLDTHSLIWFFSGDSKLSNIAKIYMENVKHQKLISEVQIIVRAWQCHAPTCVPHLPE